MISHLDHLVLTVSDPVSALYKNLGRWEPSNRSISMIQMAI